VQIPELAENVIDLPRDLALQSTAFILAFAVLSPTNAFSGLVTLIAYIGGLIIVTLFHRKAVETFRERVIARSLIASVIGGYAISILLLLYSIQILTGVNFGQLF
jgi:hypothetical protein